MAHDQPGRLSGVLERAQNMQRLPQTGEMLLGQIQQKAGDAPCMAGALEYADAFTKTSSGKRIYAWRKETIERSFAEAKELHGLRYARILGIRTRVNPKFCVNSVWVGIEQSDNRAAADLSGCRLVCIITPVGMDVKGGEAELHPKSWTVVTRQIRTGLGIGQGLTRSLGFHPIVVIVFKISD